VSSSASATDAGLDPDQRRWLETLVHDLIVTATDATPPWETRTHTWVAALAGGRRVVAQWSRNRRGLDRRQRVGRILPQVAPWIPVPEVMAHEVRGPVGLLVTRAVEGLSGRALLDDDRSAALLGARMGELARGLRRVPTRGMRLATLWGDPARLAVAAAGWLEDGRPALGTSAAAVAERLLDRVPAELGDSQPVFSHGDLAPVNVLLRDGAVVALLDFERVRLAHPLFDAAWWRWIVCHHHPERWEAAAPAFFSAAGLTFDRVLLERLDLLAVLQCLEMLHETPRSARAARSEWVERVVEALERSAPQPFAVPRSPSHPSPAAYPAGKTAP
jgi:aminoglycoside phosphotransferase (APT) family kinase protein